MFQDPDRFEIEANRRYDAPVGSVKRLEGCPPELLGQLDWSITSWDMGRKLDAQDFVDNDASITVGADGRTWENDSSGSPAVSLSVNGFPPYLRTTTGAVSGNFYQRQLSVGTRELVDFSAAVSAVKQYEVALGMVFRLSDANNDADAVEQLRLFFGLAPIDTTLFTSVDDAIGIYKADGDGLLKLICDDDSADLDSYSNTKNIVNLSTASSARDGSHCANQWLQMAFKARISLQSSNAGLIHGFFSSGQRINAGSRQPGSHVGSMALVEVPDQPITPTIAIATGEALAKNLDIAKVVFAQRYLIG